MSGKTPTRHFRWNERANRYVAPNGRFVSRTAVRGALDAALASADRRVLSLARDLRARKITLAEWQVGMRDAVREVHVYSATIARGGWAQMSAADYGRVGRVVRGQLEYLRGFAEDIAEGRQLLDGRFERRCELYTESGRRTYHLTESGTMAARGYDEERSVRHADDSCDTCVEQEDLGWQPLGEMVPIGGRDCLSRCKCSVEYRISATGDEF